jgi:hypothetical protein
MPELQGEIINANVGEQTIGYESAWINIDEHQPDSECPPAGPSAQNGESPIFPLLFSATLL